MIKKVADSYPISIFIAGEPGVARRICKTFCQEIGYCVTVTDTSYVYRDGPDADQGVIVGLINYPRFPSSSSELWRVARELAEKLREGLGQQSYSIQAPDCTEWTSYRDENR